MEVYTADAIAVGASHELGSPAWRLAALRFAGLGNTVSQASLVSGVLYMLCQVLVETGKLKSLSPLPVWTSLGTF